MLRLLALVFAALWAEGAFAAPPAPVKGPLSDWPCTNARPDALTVQDIYRKPLPAALPEPGAWKADPRIRSIVSFAAAPENPPEAGAGRIAALGSDPADTRRGELMLVLAGLVDQTNVLRGFIIDGIGEKVVKSRLLAEKLDGFSAALASAPAGRKHDLQDVRVWTNRALGDNAEDAELLCHRLEYAAAKARHLATTIESLMNRP